MNRRRFARIRAQLRLTFAWADQPLELFRTVDVSAQGARVALYVAGSSRPPVGATGECAFNVEHIELRTQATVVRHTEDGFALRFDGLPLAVQDRLAAWVFRQEALVLAGRMTALTRR